MRKQAQLVLNLSFETVKVCTCPVIVGFVCISKVHVFIHVYLPYNCILFCSLQSWCLSKVVFFCICPSCHCAMPTLVCICVSTFNTSLCHMFVHFFSCFSHLCSCHVPVPVHQWASALSTRSLWPQMSEQAAARQVHCASGLCFTSSHSCTCSVMLTVIESKQATARGRGDQGMAYVVFTDLDSCSLEYCCSSPGLTVLQGFKPTSCVLGSAPQLSCVHDPFQWGAI